MEKGDILELIDNIGMSAPIGSTARVINVKLIMTTVEIEWIDNGNTGQMNGTYDYHRFKVITHQQNNKVMSKQKLTVPVTDVLKIHKIACSTWKERISRFLSRVDNNQEITFDQEEIDEMFKAATTEQKPLLENIFGKQSKPIQWDKIKTGSKVMIRYTGDHCGGIMDIDTSKPVTVIFYNTTHGIASSGKFYPTGSHWKYCTFNQDGKFVWFSCDSVPEISYITEVLEY
jgi:hypothetical protein